METVESWSVRAVNLPEHADNPVHTDLGARAAGHERALVAGTTVYAYLTHPPAAAWGRDWLEHGGGEVRFQSPVFDDDLVEITPRPLTTPTAERTPDTDLGTGVVLEAWSRGERRATFEVWRRADDDRDVADARGPELASFDVVMDEAFCSYAARAGDDLGLDAELGVVHPVLTTVLGNRATIKSVVDGPWIHVRSRIRHLGLVRPGDTVTVASTLADRFDSRAGERAVLDVRLSVDGRPVAAVEHESIVRLRT